MITLPFHKTVISLLLYFNFFYPKYILLCLLKFLFVKRTLYFHLVIIISYFACHWNSQLNFGNCKKTLASIFECILYQMLSFLCYSYTINNRQFGANVLPPILDINFSTLYFRFPYDLLTSVSFLSMNELYYCTYKQVSQVHQQIFLYY